MMKILKILRYAALPVGITFLVGCASAGPSPKKYQSQTTTKPKPFAVVLPTSAIDFASDDKIKVSGFTTPLEIPNAEYSVSIPAISQTKLLKESCNKTKNDSDELGGVALALVGTFYKTLISNWFDSQDSKLKKKLEAYNSTYKLNTKVPLRATRCLRLVKGEHVKGEKNKGVFMPHIDALFAVKFNTQNTAQIVPIYINPTKSAIAISLTKKDPDIKKVKYAISTAVETNYLVGSPRSNPELKLHSTGEHILHKGTFSKTSEPNYCKNAKACEVNEKLSIVQKIPILGVPPGNNVSTVEFTISEAAESQRKDNLETWRKFLSTSKDDVTTTLSTAIQALFESEDDDDTSGATESDDPVQ